MEEMVEPDRTILIVSVIGLVIIWGSVAYHRFVQGGPLSDRSVADPSADDDPVTPPASGATASAAADQAAGSSASTRRRRGRPRS